MFRISRCRRKCTFILILAIIVVLFVYSNNTLKLHAVSEAVVREQNIESPEDRYFEKKKDVEILEEVKKDCKIYSLEHKSDWTKDAGSNHQRGCRVASPHAESCQIANDLLFTDPMPTCDHQVKYDFCYLEGDSASGWTVSCNAEDTSSCGSNFYLGLLEPQGGDLVWEEFSSPSLLEKHLMQIMNENAKASNQRNFGFCFIRCGNESETDYGPDDEAMYGELSYNEIRFQTVRPEQLLILPPSPSRLEDEVKKNDANIFDGINVNLILIDSVSRQHFYRSLKETVVALDEINALSEKSASVLDFELMQAVRSRTFETLQTVFSGHIDPSITPFGTLEIPPEPLNLKPLLGAFKSMGYTTLWLEDLCHLWEWGISKDMHFLDKNSTPQETWARMRQKLAENMVDGVDLTLAQCQLLAANGVNDHFHGPDVVCFNGRHQHEYIFQYLSLYHDFLLARKKPFFSFTATNVGHERSGRRIQTLDNTLSQYVRTAATLKNTLTILFSDHGNSYGSFAESVPDNRIEVFHPFMFFIIPDSVSSKLGHNNMKSLGINSQRLVSALDLHYTLAHLSNPASTVSPRNKQYSVSRRGLFDIISADKTCGEIPLIMPNLCICENFDQPVSNTSALSIMAYFAIGQLNNKIQEEQLKRQKLTKGVRPEVRNAGKELGFSCEKLVLHGIRNIRRSVSEDGSHAIKMELLVQESQIFFVAISVNVKEDKSFGARMEQYDRLTSYGQYAACSDVSDLSLCICNAETGDEIMRFHPANDPVQSVQPYLLPQFKSSVKKLQSYSSCLFLHTIKNEQGAVISVINQCLDKAFTLNFVIEVLERLKYWSAPSPTSVMMGGSLNIGFLYEEEYQPWTFFVKVETTLISSM